MDRSADIKDGSLSIVIITRNTKKLLLELLASLHEDKELSAQIGEIIIVDNGSVDGSGETARAEFPQTILLRNEINRGFAAAVNQAWRTARGELILLLNSDTRVLPGELPRVVAYMRGNPKVGIVGPALVYDDMRPQRSFASIPSLIQEIVPRFLLELVAPARHGGKTWGSRVPEVVESLIGAAILVRRTVLEDLEGFDERFFFFLEETDFSKRARQQGWQVIFFPSARIVHYQGKTVGANWVKGRIEYNISLDKFIRKHHGAVYHGLFRTIRTVKTFLTLIGSTLLLPFIFFDRSMSRRYSYHLQLSLWYLRGCPDNQGLRL